MYILLVFSQHLILKFANQSNLSWCTWWRKYWRHSSTFTQGRKVFKTVRSGHHYFHIDMPILYICFSHFTFYIVMEANLPSSSLDPSGVAARSLPSGKAILSFMFLMRWSAFALSKAFSWAERLRIISIPSVEADVVSLVSTLLATVSTTPGQMSRNQLIPSLLLPMDPVYLIY